MIICSCKVVSDHQIRNTVKDGAKSWKQCVKLTEVSTGCGTCAIQAKAIYDEAAKCGPKAPPKKRKKSKSEAPIATVAAESPPDTHACQPGSTEASPK